jgi:hypothetical protein
MNPVRPVYRRSFTPIPNTRHQPAEVAAGLPSAKNAHDQAQEAIALVLSISHSLRQAREEGVL